MTVFSFVSAMISPSVVAIVNRENPQADPQVFFSQLAHACDLTITAGTGQIMLQGDWKGFNKAYDILEAIRVNGNLRGYPQSKTHSHDTKSKDDGKAKDADFQCDMDNTYSDSICKHSLSDIMPCLQKVPSANIESRKKIEAALEGLTGLSNPTNFSNIRPFIAEVDERNIDQNKKKGIASNDVDIEPTLVATVEHSEGSQETPLKIIIYHPKKSSDSEINDGECDDENDDVFTKDITIKSKRKSLPPRKTEQTNSKTRIRKSRRPQKVNFGEEYQADSENIDENMKKVTENEGNVRVDELSSDDEEKNNDAQVKLEKDVHVDSYIEEFDPGKDGAKEFTCKECGHATREKTILKEHILRKHLDGKDKKCHICGKCYSVNKDLQRHLQRHSVRHTCGVCGKQYKAQRNLREHMNIHRDDYIKPSYPCTECNRRFSAKHTLQTHFDAVHRGIKKSFLCTVCGKNFTQKQTMLDHLMIHSGERPFQCEICGSDFNNKQTLKRHRRLHTEVARFQCELCGKEFRSKAGLRMHRASHMGTTPQHKCSVCNKIFTQKQALLRHSRIHSGEKPFKCDQCSDQFSDLSILRRHVIGVHKMEFKTKRPRIQPAPMIYKPETAISQASKCVTAQVDTGKSPEQSLIPFTVKGSVSYDNSISPTHSVSTVEQHSYPPNHLAHSVMQNMTGEAEHNVHHTMIHTSPSNLISWGSNHLQNII